MLLTLSDLILKLIKNLINWMLRNFNLTFIGLCLILILPYLIAAFYIEPNYDDFYFSSAIRKMGAFGFTDYFYHNWSGRYSSVFIFSSYDAHIVGTSNCYYVLFSLILMAGLILSVFCLDRKSVV